MLLNMLGGAFAQLPPVSQSLSVSVFYFCCLALA